MEWHSACARRLLPTMTNAAFPPHQGVRPALHLSPLAKIGAQLGAAAVVLAAGVRVEIVSNGVLATALGIVWLVGMTNAFSPVTLPSGQRCVTTLFLVQKRRPSMPY